ncbi:MAG: ABC transporter ATP-binding protein [Myxococcota bacterium]
MADVKARLPQTTIKRYTVRVSDKVVLRTEQIRFSYGRHAVLNGLDLAVPAGQVYGFLGRNGAGKTTTIQILLGILVPNAGTIHFNQQQVRRTTAAMKRRIGYVSQRQFFYDWMRVRQLGRFVAGFYPTWSEGVFRALLDRLQIDRAQRVGALSGGTRMKLAMALALAPEPELLVLDEPTAGVDPIARREILDLLRDVCAADGRTVLFSTHNIDEVEKIADVAGILHQGVLAFQGPVNDLGDVEEAFLRIVLESSE